MARAPMSAQSVDDLDRLLLHPFQCIAPLQQQQPKENGSGIVTVTKLLAACGLRLFLVDFDSGMIDSYWDGDAHGSKGAILKLAVSRCKKYIAVVTSEDKAVHILAVTSSTLEHKNKRCMPKRPCALVWNPDSKFVLVADKFGDVYGLDIEGQTSTEVAIKEEAAEPLTKRFKPSATPLTVHTKGNLRALENQIRMAEESKKKEKDYDTSMQPVLGHVSMVTDLVAFNGAEMTKTGEQIPFPLGECSIAAVKAQGSKRPVIVTSDRDEHIRISRGIPQAHIIHSHCWGHREFISKLAVVRNGEYLISGGGDPWLGVWLWNTGELLAKLDFPPAHATPRVNEESSDKVEDNDDGEDDAPGRTLSMAVSGIFVPEDDAASGSGKNFDLIVTVEGEPSLFQYSGSVDDGIEFVEREMPSNVLDLALLKQRIAKADGSEETKRLAVVSFDTFHDTGSITQPDLEGVARPRLRVIDIDGDISDDSNPEGENDLIADQFHDNFKRSIDAKGLEVTVRSDAKLADLFYGIRGLRKRGGTAREEAED